MMSPLHCKHEVIHSQGEDFVPLWVEVFVDGVRLQSVVVQLQHAERIALTYATIQPRRMDQKDVQFMTMKRFLCWFHTCNICSHESFSSHHFDLHHAHVSDVRERLRQRLEKKNTKLTSFLT